MQYESTFNAIDNILRNEAGCSTELDYIEQTSWLLFLKYLDDLDREREDKALLAGKDYKPILTGYMRWSQWAAPKKADGTLDTVNAMTGPDLTAFVDGKLFPTLREFQNTATSAKTLEYKIGEIFAELKNKITSGYNLREVINLIDQLHFQSAEDKHEMTVLYESKIAKMGNAGRNGGEYYTPRPLIRTIVKVVDPKIGETVYDPACGSAGFLCEAFTYMSQQVKSTSDARTLQESTFFGKEKKPLPYIIATMNMIFHGLQAPNIIRGNTLAENLSQIQEKDRKNVILANPPFGGSERAEVKQNFDINTSETAYMFMQHFIKMMKAGGRAGIVIKNTFLSNGDAAALRKLLLDQCNLHTVLDLPGGVFQGAGVKTVVLFFDKGTPTQKIWYYQLNPGRNLGKTNALNENDLAEFLEFQKTKPDSENSWTVDVSTLGSDFDLSVKNPNKVEKVDDRTPLEIFHSIENLNNQVNMIVNDIFQFTKKEFVKGEEWKCRKLGDLCKLYQPHTISTKEMVKDGQYDVFGANGIIGKYNKYNHEFSEIIMTCRGATCGTINISTPKSWINGNAMVIHINDESVINREFLVYILSFIDKTHIITGAAQPQITRQTLSPLEICYPKLSEQMKIVSHLNSLFNKINSLEDLLRTKITESDALKQALLRQVFE